jgi:subtilisin family serine protease
MRKSLPLLSATLAALTLATACADPIAPVAPPAAAPPTASRVGDDAASDVIPDQYIVVFRRDVNDAPGLARRLAAANGASVRFAYAHAIKGFAGRMSAQAAAALARNPNVAYVEQDQVVTASATQSNATWGLDRIDARSGLDGSYSYAATGAGVTAYIIDTGILLGHDEFGGRAVTGYDAVTSGGPAADCNGHGTHVAGTVGGTTYGVAKDVRLVAVRVLDCGGSGSWSGVIAGIDWVTADHRAGSPAAANLSLGGGASASVDEAVQRMIDDGVATAVAAGNGNKAGIAQDACKYSPARVPDAMTIGATTQSDAKSSWSNYGSCVDWFAPGSGITSAWYTSNSATNTISGTSMATPHVAGVAALYLQNHTGATALQVRDALYALTTRGVVTSSSTANNHLLYSLEGGTTPPPTSNTPPSASFAYSCSGTSCSFTDQSSDSDGGVVAWSWSFGDGASSTVQNPSHDFAEGSFTVALTVTDDDGATGNASTSVSCRKRGRTVSCR